MVASRIKKKSLGRPPLPRLITDDAETAAEAAEACSVSISRPIYDHDSFSKHYKQTSKPKTPLTEVICNGVKDAVTCNKRKCMTSLRKWLPFVGIMRHYKRKWIVGDIISGISCGTVHIPQSLGYATLIGLPAVYGLYSSFFPLLVYFFFGTSHHLSIGTVAVVSLIVSSAVTKQLPNLRYVLDPIVNATTTTAMPSGSQPVNPNACASDMSTMSTAATGFSDAYTALDQYTTSDATATSTVAMATAASIDPSLQQEAVILMVVTMTFVVGIMQLGMGLCHLGVISSFMSTPFNTAYQTAAAFHTATSQLAACLGYTIGAYPGVFTLINQLKDIFTHLYKTNAADVVVAVVSLVVLVFIKEFINVKFAKKLPVPIPADLLVVVVGTLTCHLAKLNQKYCVKVVGDIPRGFPTPEVPILLTYVDKDYYYLPTFIIHLDSSFILDCLAVAIVSYVMCMTMAKMFARKYRYALDDDQELVAYGLMNLCGSFFHCFPTAQSPPRTTIFESTGGMTQVSGVISAVVVMIVILALGPLFYSLPKALLAMIIIVALFPLFKQFRELKVYWKINKFDFFVWIATFVAVIILDLPTGLAVGIGWNLLTMCAQSFVVRGYNLSSANHSDLFVASKSYAKVSDFQGIFIFRYEADIFFANVANFKKQLFKSTVNPNRLQLLKEKLAAAHESGSKSDLDIAHVVVDPSPASNNGLNNKAYLAYGDETYEANSKNKSTLNSNNNNQPNSLPGSPNPITTKHESFDNLKHVTIVDLKNSKTVPANLATSGSGGDFGHKRTRSEDGIAAAAFNDFYLPPDLDTISIDEDNEDMADAVSDAGSALHEQLGVHTVVLDCGAVGYIDFNGLLAIRQLFEDYRDAEITFLLAGCGKFMMDKLKTSGIYEEWRQHIFPSIIDAVLTTQIRHKVSQLSVRL